MPSDSWSANGSYVTSYEGTLSVSQVSQNIETNKTLCRASLLLDNNAYNYFRGFAVTGTFSRDGSVLNSVSFSGNMEPNGDAQYHSLYLFQDFEFEVEHDTNGARTISVSATITTATKVIGGAKVGAGQINITGGTLTLDTIPRASSLTAPSIELEQTGTLTITRQDSSFKDTITWECLGLTGGFVYTPNGSLSQTVSFDTSTIASNIYPLIPDTTSAEIFYTINTYLSDGTTLIGTKVVKSTLTVGDSIVPSFILDNRSWYFANDNAWLESEMLPVAGFSRIISNIRRMYSPGAGANPGNATYSIDGQTGTVPAMSADGWESPNPINSTRPTLTVVASDSRGRTTKHSITIGLLEYSAPAITSFKTIRGTYSGGVWTSDPTGPHIRVMFNASVSLAIHGNTGDSVVIGCTGQTSQTLTDVTSGTVYFDSTDATHEYTITLAFTDKVGTTTNRKLKVLSAAADFNFNTNLPALGLGRLATRANMVESAWNMEVEKASGEAYYSAKNPNGEGRLRVSSSGVTGLYNQAFNSEAGKWIIYDDASGHSLIPDHLLPTTEMSTASITLPSESGQVIRSHYNGTQVINIPDGTPSGWWCVVVRSRNQATNFVCGGSDGLVISGESSIPTSYSVSGLGTYLLVRIAGTRVALSIDAGAGGGGGGGTVAWNDITGKPTFAAVATTGDYDDLTDKPTLATVATTGDYDDLIDKPTIPTALSQLSDDTTHRVVTDTQISTWNGKSDFSGDYDDLTNKPTLATVATTGDYDDLTDKPTIPSQGQMWFGTSSTAGGTATKATTITGFPSTLTDGLTVAVRFANANTVSSPKLSINSGTAVAIRRYGTTAPSTSAALSWQAGTVVLMCYYSGYWYIVNWLNTTYGEISEANIESLTGSTTGLITGRRFTAGFNARLTSAAIATALGYTPADAADIPTAVSDLTNDSGFLTLATLPVWDGSVT